MVASRKKKALLLTILSSLTLAASATAVLFIGGKDRFSGTSAGSRAAGSILFSRETGEFTKISDTKSSISGTTSNGAKYYAYSRSISDVSSTNYIAAFGFAFGISYDEQYITFSTSPTDDSDFEFQSVTGIKVTTTSSSDQTLYLYYSSDGVNFNNSQAVVANSNPSRVNLTSPQSFVRLGTSTTQTRNIVSVELFYDCGDSEPEPEPKVVDHLSFGSMKSNYVLGENFEEPEVIAYYTDSTHETVEASFSTPDMTVSGKQTVTASYGGVDKNFTIEIWPSATAQRVTFAGGFSLIDYDEHGISEFLESSSVLPAYGEPGQTVSFTPVLKSAYMFVDAYDNNGAVESFNYDGTNVTFTMPSSGVEIYIVYQANPYKQISYVGFDLGTYDYAETSIFLDALSLVPSQAEPGDTVSVTPIAKSGFALDGVIDMNEDVTIEENSGVYSFTMPSYNFEVTILFHEVITLESISVSNPKTTYVVGSSFVIPTVIGHYSNGAEAALEVTGANFSGFNSETAVEEQVITVSYEGVESIQYTISIEDSEIITLNGTYTNVHSSTMSFTLVFNGDGSGTYNRVSASPATVSFKWSLNGNQIHIYEISSGNSNFASYRLTEVDDGTGTNDSGVVNSDGSVTISVVNYKGVVYATKTFSK